MNTYYEAVLKNPQEDRIRWEWLEQVPNALMELQLNRARRDRRGDGSRRGIDLYEEKILLEQYPQLDAPSSFFQLTYQRGLIQHVRGSYELIRRHGAEILASYPILQLSFYEIPDCALMPIEMNQLQNIVALDLYSSQASDQLIDQLIDWDPPALRWLDIRRNSLSPRVLDRLFKSNLSQRLLWLDSPHSRRLHDEVEAEDNRIIDWIPTSFGKNLEESIGKKLSWLHYRVKDFTFFPPPMSLFAGYETWTVSEGIIDWWGARTPVPMTVTWVWYHPQTRQPEALLSLLEEDRDIKVILGSQFYIESQQYTVVGITVSSKGGTVKFRDSGEFWIHT